jgi:dienelactone hydrolase
MTPTAFRAVFAFTLSLLLSVAPCAAQLPAAGPDAETVRRAEAVIAALAEGRFADVFAAFDEKMRAGLPLEKLAAGWTAAAQGAGEFRRMTGVRTDTREAYRIAVVTCEFARASIDVQVVFDPQHRIAGLAMRPTPPATASAPPPYADPERFTEEEVTTGAPGWPLPGTLTLPVGDGPFPAVVLVHGSGPQDRDATIGPNKPLRDLAQGLATRGVAVLRYVKRSQAHAQRMAPLTTITVQDESIDDVLAAVALLRQSPRIDATRIYVLGHSMGGMLVPRIAAADTALAGAIVMAGSVRSIEQAIVEQTRYLLIADGDLTDADRDQLMQVEQLAAQVRALGPSDAESGRMLGGAPASYWLDLRGYDPPRAASRLALPFLVLQGERDYQVTMADFSRWRAALESRANVALRSYPALNHLFMPGAGPSLPNEYLNPGHVDRAVIDDIATWIQTGRLPER